MTSNRFRNTLSSSFPPSLVSAAAFAASTEALDAYWRAERDLSTGARPATVVHAEVLRTTAVARSLARVAR